MTKTQKALLYTIFFLESGVLSIQFCTYFANSPLPVPQAILRLLSYFGVNTHVIVLLCTASLIFRKKPSFFSRQSTITAVSVYAFITLITYNFLFRLVVNSQGLERVLNEFVGLINPVLFLIYWYLYGNKKNLVKDSILFWLIFPFVYFNYVLICANWSGFYPYPFFDIKTFGFKKVLINCVGLSVFAIGVSYTFLLLGNYLVKREIAGGE